MSGDRVVVIEPNGVKRSRPVTPQGLTIGRGDENDLVINYAAASRSHALVTFDRGRYYVIDLGSANGTYLGNARLDSHTPTLWATGQSMHIGDVEIQLHQSGTAGAATETFVGLPSELGGAAESRPKVGALKWILIALLLALVLVIVVVGVSYFLLS
jgi:pSer/pThr/pTyr-binding forkhead associated (FHA) protein